MRRSQRVTHTGWQGIHPPEWQPPPGHRLYLGDHLVIVVDAGDRWIEIREPDWRDRLRTRLRRLRWKLRG